MATNTGFVITDDGLAAATTATPAGPFIHITEFRVSSAVNFTPNGEETALPGTIRYTGGVTNYYVVDYDTIELILFMDATVGDFTFGSIGIYLEDGTLFAISAFDTLQEKIRALGTQAGTQWRIRARLKLARASVICQVDVITSIQILEVSSWPFLVTPVNQVGNANMAIVNERTPHSDSILVFKTDDDTWAINDFTQVFRGSTDDAGASIGTSSVQHPSLSYGYFSLPRNDSRYVIKFPDGDIRKVVNIAGDDELVFSPAKAVPLTGEFSIWEESQSVCCRTRWAGRKEYNDFVTAFNVLWTTPTGTHPTDNEGLNQVPLQVLAAPHQPSMSHWTKLHNAVIAKCKIHGVPFSSVAFTDYAYCCDDAGGSGWGLKTIADQFEYLEGLIPSLITNRNTAATAYQESVIPVIGTAQRTAIWSGTKQHVLTLTYSSANAFRGMVNGGHQLKINASVQTGSSAGWLALKSFLASIGTITIDRGDTKSSGAGSDDSTGLHDLTSSNQLMFQHTQAVTGGALTLQVYGRRSSNVVTITINYINTGSGAYYYSGTPDLFKSQLAMRKPQSAVLTTPVLEYPTVVSTGDLSNVAAPAPPPATPITHLSTTSTQRTTTGTSLSIAKPASLVAGDLLVAVMGAKTNVSSGSWTPASGFTEGREQSTGGPKLMLASLEVAGSEASSFAFTFSEPLLLGGCIMAFRNAVLDVVGQIGDASSGGTMIVPSITPANGAKIYLAVFDQDGSVTVPNISGWTQVANAVNSDGNGPSWRVFSRDLVADGSATGTMAVNTSASSGKSAGIMFALL